MGISSLMKNEIERTNMINKMMEPYKEIERINKEFNKSLSVSNEVAGLCSVVKQFDVKQDFGFTKIVNEASFANTTFEQSLGLANIANEHLLRNTAFEQSLTFDSINIINKMNRSYLDIERFNFNHSFGLAEIANKAAKDIQLNFNLYIPQIEPAMSFNMLGIEQITKPLNSFEIYNSNFEKMFNNSTYVWLQNNYTDLFYTCLYKLKEITPNDFNEEKCKTVLKNLCDMKWVPCLIYNSSYKLITKISRITENKAEDARYKELIDEAIFKYYTKEKIEDILENWKYKNLDGDLCKMLLGRAEGYYDAKYDIAVSLNLIWESIIYSKVNYENNNVKKSFKELIEHNSYPNEINNYFLKYIWYSSHKKEDFIPDVPGRHITAHTLSFDYPTKKAALNAILFTDFLLNLEPLPLEKQAA